MTKKIVGVSTRPEDSVRAYDGGWYYDKGLARAEERFFQKIIVEPGHAITVTWDVDEGREWQPIQFSIDCSCGTASGWGWNDRGLNVDGNMPKRAIMTANTHVLHEQREKNYQTGKDGQPEPRLIAKVYMARVTHEWWVAHQETDLVQETLYPKGHQQPMSNNWPWKVFQKNSARYKFVASHRTQEQAVAAVLKYVERERFRGNSVEILDSEIGVGIEAPAATIASAVSKLIDQAKKLKKNPSPHSLATILQATDEGMAQLELLDELRGELRNRFGQALDLG